MKIARVLLPMLLLATGCATQPATQAPSANPLFASNDNDQRSDSSTVVLHLLANGDLYWNKWLLTPTSMAAFAKQIGSASVVIKGEVAAAFSRAVDVQDELKAAGVEHVTIAP